MCPYLLLAIISLFITVRAQHVANQEIVSNATVRNLNQIEHETVKLQLFYESFCPDCRTFATTQLAPTVKKLGCYLDIHLYPYGIAHTKVFSDGSIKITCQHGQDECYGNMLHACAIDYLANIIKAVEFNSCLMHYSRKKQGSDDQAVNKCAKRLHIRPDPIKRCAKSVNGLLLLKKYGDESKKAGFKFVPYVLLNGVESCGDNLFTNVCSAFKIKPKECG